MRVWRIWGGCVALDRDVGRGSEVWRGRVTLVELGSRSGK